MTNLMIEAAARGLLLAMVVGAGLSVLRVTNVPVRKAAWSLVLVASLAMPFLMRWPAVTGLAQGIGWVLPIHEMEASRPAANPMLVAPVSAVASEEFSAEAQSAAVHPRRKAGAIVGIPTEMKVAENREAPADAGVSAGPSSASVATQPVHRSWQWPPVERMMVWLYLTVSGALLLRLLWGVGAAVWLWARAEEISPLDVPEENVRVSSRIPGPVTIGSGIVLPGNFREWHRAKLRVVLAHERSHVRQMDFYLQLLAGLYAAIFWFSPLGWWLKRTLSHLGEAISDRAGLQAASSRSDYAGVLLEFAATAGRALPGVAMARKGNLSRRVEHMLNERWVQRAFAEGRRRALISLLLVPAAVFAVTALVRVPGAAAQEQSAVQPTPPQTAAPVVQDERVTQPMTGQANPPESQVMTMTPQTAQSPETAQSPAAPVSPEGPPAAAEPVVPQDAPQTPQPAPAPQAAQVAPPAVVAAPQAAPAPEPPSDEDMPMVLDMGAMPDVKFPKMPKMKIVVPKGLAMLDGELPQLMTLDNLGSDFTLLGPGESFYLGPSGGSHGYAYYFSSNGDSWAIVDGAGSHFSMGSGTDKHQLDLAQRMAKGPFLWFSHDGKSYIVDDPAVVARIRSLYAPMRDLAQRQEQLGIRRRVMGRMDAELARQQRSDANVRIPDLSKEMADAEAALNSLKAEQGQMLSQEKLAEMQSKLAEMEAKLGSLEARSVMQNNFGEKMRALGEQQRQMGEQQRDLGEQQKKLAGQAQEQVQKIIQECLRNGKATPVK